MESTITEVRLAVSLENNMISATRQRLPYETCGVVFGVEFDGIILADGFSIIRNISPSPLDSFSFHPEDWIAITYKAQKNQRTIVGLFHTHPKGSTRPSLHDSQGSIPWGTYWIISLAQSNHVIAVFTRNSQGDWVGLPIKSNVDSSKHITRPVL
ncbi:Mov34/MPN/PAD-1 family protein [Cohnella sp. WQ 127256]|uniref:Mov34/MPN/PAD-1 family protein n=1 Tax=Cohnella sp. WQ 127256 TaxID=2938790 RepID=UPI0021191408|nr:M67 family metallopeptidase [Cohnella sp. WQ 127256]